MFQNREEAGILLAQKLLSFFSDKKDTVVVGIARGGVVVAKAISDLLHLPLDSIVIKKIGAPANPELAIGAVGPLGVVCWDIRLCKKIGITKEIKNQLLRIKNKERKERERYLRGSKSYAYLKNKMVFIIDDGVATGTTALCVAKSLRKVKARYILLGTPVISSDAYIDLGNFYDRIVALCMPKEFYAVGQFYEEFQQVTDGTIKQILI